MVQGTGGKGRHGGHEENGERMCCQEICVPLCVHHYGLPLSSFHGWDIWQQWDCTHQYGSNDIFQQGAACRNSGGSNRVLRSGVLPHVPFLHAGPTHCVMTDEEKAIKKGLDMCGVGCIHTLCMFQLSCQLPGKKVEGVIEWREMANMFAGAAGKQAIHTMTS